MVPKASGVEASAQRKCLERFRQKDEIQDGNHQLSSRFHLSGRLDDIPGRAGCLFPYSGSPGLEKIPTFRFRGPDLSISSTLFQSLDSPTSLHLSVGSFGGLATFSGSKDLAISG